MADTIKITTLAQLKVALQAAKTYIDGQIGGLGTMAGKSEVATGWHCRWCSGERH